MPSGQSIGTKITWDDAADKRLLMAMLKVLSPSPPKFEDVAIAMGEGVTKLAVSQRWGKLKKQLEGGGSTPSTPAKGGGGGAKKATPGSKSASKRKVKDFSDDGEASELTGKPAMEDAREPIKKVKVDNHSLEDEDEVAEWMI